MAKRNRFSNPAGMGKMRPYTEEVEVHVLFKVKRNRRWDIGNRLKFLLDCLQS